MAGWNYGEWRLGKRDGQWIARRPIGHGKWQRDRLGVKISAGKSAGQKALVEHVQTLELTSGLTSVPTIEDIFLAYAKDRERDGINTVNILGNWKNLKPTFAPLTLDSLTDEICREYAEDREDLGRSRATIWTELSRLRTALNWHCRRERILPPPVWVPSKGKGRDRTITREEAQRLLHHAVTPHIRLFIILAITTGARRGAILDLTWDRVDFEANEIRLKAEKAPACITDRSWRKGRANVPMVGLARAALQTAYSVRQGPYVISQTGKQIKDIKTGFKATARRAGLVGVSAHTLRHSVATWLKEDGVSMQQISQILGHSQQSITETIYAHATTDGVREAAQKLDLRVIQRP